MEIKFILNQNLGYTYLVIVDETYSNLTFGSSTNSMFGSETRNSESNPFRTTSFFVKCIWLAKNLIQTMFHSGLCFSEERLIAVLLSIGRTTNLDSTIAAASDEVVISKTQQWAKAPHWGKLSVGELFSHPNLPPSFKHSWFLSFLVEGFRPPPHHGTSLIKLCYK